MFDKTHNWKWLNEPDHSFDHGVLNLHSKGDTDFWQRTHYGFSPDNGHALLADVEGDFSLTARCTFTAVSRFDQGGLMVRIDSENWIKVSIEAESKHINRLGSVATNLGYSDWATTDIDAAITSMWYRVQAKGADLLIEHALDGKQWKQMRIVHLHAHQKKVAVGIYACSPIAGNGCTFMFDNVQIGPRSWEDE